MKYFSSILSSIIIVLAITVCLQVGRVNDLSKEIAALEDRTEALVNHEKVTESKISVIGQNSLSKENYFHILRSTVKIYNPGGFQGSGVVLYSQRRSVESGDTNFYTYILTCAHLTHTFNNVKVEHFEYRNARDVESISIFNGCEVIFEDTGIDLAIVEVKSLKAFMDIVSLATLTQMQDMSLSDPIFLAGCGLGSDPYITIGNFASFDSIGGEIQITAPAIFGNSGGGAFTHSGKLVGVLSAIKATQTFPQVAYPNAGLVVPFWMIRGWVRSEGMGFIIGDADGTSIDTTLKIREEKAQEQLEKDLEEFMKPFSDHNEPALPEKDFK